MTTEQSQLDAIYTSIIKVVERRISKEEAQNADLASTELKIRKIIGEWLSLMGKTLSPEDQKNSDSNRNRRGRKPCR
jgi:hypothetical protein